MTVDESVPSTETQPAPVEAPPRAPHGGTGMVAALVVAVAAMTMVNSMTPPAIPDMTQRLHTTGALVGLAQAVCYLIGALLAVVAASYSDHSERKRLLIGALLVMCAGDVLGALAPNIWVLLGARFLQSAGGCVFVLGLLILGDTLPPRQFGRAMGVLTAVFGGMVAINGVVGGALTDAFSFRAVFLAMAAFGVLAALVVARYVPAHHGTAPGRMDWAGAITLCLSLLLVQLGLGMVGTAPAGAVGTLVVAGLLLFGLFLLIESRRSAPLVPLRYLRSRQAWPVLATSALICGGVYSVTNYTLPVLAQDPQHGYGLTATAMSLLYIVPFCVMSVLAAPVAGHFLPQAGWQRVLRLTTAGIVPLMVLLALTYASPWVVFGLLLVVAPLQAAAMTSINGLSVLLAPSGKTGVLPGLNTAAFGVGASLGIAVASQLAGWMPGVVPDYQGAIWMSVAGTALAVVAALFVANRAQEPAS